MKRRAFAKLVTLPLALGKLPKAAAGEAGTGSIKLGNQNWSDDPSLRVLAALGVNHICSALPSAKLDDAWSVQGLVRLLQRVESFGIRPEAVPFPLISSYITMAENPDIMLGKSPERDREIDDICTMIRNCGRAGIPMVKYNLTISVSCEPKQRPDAEALSTVLSVIASQTGSAADRSRPGER